MQRWFGRGCDFVVKYALHEELEHFAFWHLIQHSLSGLPLFQFHIYEVLRVLFRHTFPLKECKTPQTQLGNMDLLQIT